MNRNTIPAQPDFIRRSFVSGDVEPVSPKTGLRIRAFREVIAQYLPALGLAERGPVNENTSAIDTSPLVTSWYTLGAGQFARVVEIAGRGAVTTWPSRDLPHVDIGQSLPTYSDVQQIDKSDDYVYITSTGLPSHPIGPWKDQNGVLGTWPTKHRRTYRFPRQPWLAHTSIVTPPGDVGVWVNGIPVSNILVGRRYDPERNIDVSDRSIEPYHGLWLRVIDVEPGPHLDPANGRPSETGEYRYYANPIALRSQLRDNVVYLPRADCYREDTTKLRHSPILGWTFEGLPIYGPYGYSDPLDSAGGIRRMVSGFVLRDGRNGTVDIARRGRRTLPGWAAALHGTSEQLRTRQFGPDVTPEFELGCYVEDYDYLGDLGFVQGTDFDLDQCNGRFCVTPEFPEGTFAYFISLHADGVPAFPYVVGPLSYGVRDGGTAELHSTETTAVVRAGAKAPVRLHFRNVGSQQLLTWTSIEGGHYSVDGSVDGRNWTNIVENMPGQGLTTEYTVYLKPGCRPYRHFSAKLMSIDAHDE